MVAFFLQDTFPNQVVYAKAINDIAEYRVVGYEDFVLGSPHTRRNRAGTRPQFGKRFPREFLLYLNLKYFFIKILR